MNTETTIASGLKIVVTPEDPELARAKELLREKGYVLTRKNMTEQEERVSALVAEGYGNKEVANLLNITEATVKVHLKSVLRRHNMANRTQLAVFLKTGIRPAAAPV